jgi:hypothetical protein
VRAWKQWWQQVAEVLLAASRGVDTRRCTERSVLQTCTAAAREPTRDRTTAFSGAASVASTTACRKKRTRPVAKKSAIWAMGHKRASLPLLSPECCVRQKEPLEQSLHDAALAQYRSLLRGQNPEIPLVAIQMHQCFLFKRVPV